MPIGTSDGQVYEDELDYLVSNIGKNSYLSQVSQNGKSDTNTQSESISAADAFDTAAARQKASVRPLEGRTEGFIMKGLIGTAKAAYTRKDNPEDPPAYIDHSKELDYMTKAYRNLFGIGTERYQLWPERLFKSLAESVYSGATLPGDILNGYVEYGGEEYQKRMADLIPLAIGAPPATGLINKTLLDAGHSFAINNYAGDAYRAMNKMLRGESTENFIKQSYLWPQVKLIDSFIEHATPVLENKTVYRGVSSKKEDFSQLVPGQDIQWPAFTSSSYSPYTAKSFASGDKSYKAIFAIDVPKGSKALDLAKDAAIGFEKELLFPRNSKFQVLQIGKGPQGENLIRLRHLPERQEVPLPLPAEGSKPIDFKTDDVWKSLRYSTNKKTISIKNTPEEAFQAYIKQPKSINEALEEIHKALQAN